MDSQGRGAVPRRPTTWLQVSAYRYLSRRLECALLGQPAVAGVRARGQPAALAAGAVLTAAALVAATLLGLLRPHVALDGARVVLARESGALFVRVGDTWHPVLNLASARLIAASAVDPLTIRQADLDGSKRGPLLGIPGAPAFLGRPLAAADTAWSLCDSDGAAATTILLGRPDATSMHVLGGGQAMLVAAGARSPAYLLHDGHRARVDLADAAVVRALRFEGRVPRLVSQSLLDAVPEAAPITAPRIPGLGGAAPGLPGFAVGTVLRITRADGDEYYAVLAAGVQRIGRVAADLLRLSNPQGSADAVTVAPDALRAAPVVTALPVAGLPDRAPAVSEPAATICAGWGDARSVAFVTGAALPVPPGRAPVTLAQADGRGPALDAVYLPPGRCAYVRAGANAGTRYLIADTGVRFAVPDDDAAADLGLGQPSPAPWPLLTLLPAGPELSRPNASVARDTVAGAP